MNNFNELNLLFYSIICQVFLFQTINWSKLKEEENNYHMQHLTSKKTIW